MPRLSDSMEEGTVVSWLVDDGAAVVAGDALLEIETDKATMVFEADAGGRVEQIAREGETLAIGTLIARILTESEQTNVSVAKPSPAPRTAVDEVGGQGLSPTQSAQPPRTPRIKASPLARRQAEAAGLDLVGLTGSGPGGRIVRKDVEAALASGSAPDRGEDSASRRPGSSPAQAGSRRSPPSIDEDHPPAPVSRVPAGSSSADQALTAKGTTETVELNKLQQTVARRMAESKAVVPHFYLQAEFDLTRAHQARRRLSTGSDERKPSFNDLIVKACAIALREFPHANGAYRDGKWELYERVNIGIAVAADGALIVPTIFDADRKGLAEIAAESRLLAERVREGRITPPELSGGTFTVSNLGMLGISNFHPVINLPQAGILAVGAISETPVVRDGAITTAKLMGVTLACDHRILYGADGARFLGRVRALLEEPLGLAL